MRFPHRIGTKTAVATVGVAAALAAGGTAYAASASTAPSSPPASAVTAATGPGRHPTGRALLSRADHASVEVRVKGQWVTYDVDRGRVTSVSSSSITLDRPDGQSVTEAIVPTTRFTGVTSWSAVHPGAPVMVISQSGTARRIHQRPGA